MTNKRISATFAQQASWSHSVEHVCETVAPRMFDPEDRLQ